MLYFTKDWLRSGIYAKEGFVDDTDGPVLHVFYTDGSWDSFLDTEVFTSFDDAKAYVLRKMQMLIEAVPDGYFTDVLRTRFNYLSGLIDMPEGK